MDHRHSSPSQRTSSPRPRVDRQRSNSMPIVEALGCSTPEAELILAEGRAAVRSRYAATQRRGRRDNPDHDASTKYRPRDHLIYLNGESEEGTDVGKSEPGEARTSHHTRTPSDVTDRSTSTITGTAPSVVPDPLKSPASPLWDYSANLAKFIQTQLNSISTYNPMTYLRSSDPSPRSRTPQLPTRTGRRSLETPGLIEIPPIRPPLKSAFSAWSSTDEETDDYASSPRDTSQQRTASVASNYTPSAILRYYENSSDSSFLLTTTPLEEHEPRQHVKAREPSIPDTKAVDSHSTTPYENDYPSSTLSTHPQLSSSSAPSLSSTSTASYFECKRAKPLAVHVKDRTIATDPSHQSRGKVFTAISPFEGGALANVHDIFVEPRNRVLVDGLSFDMVHTSNMSDEMQKTVQG